MKRVAELLAILLVALFLVLSLAGTHGNTSPIRNHVVEHGSEETGALNLVTAIYLGYRAYDTLGETIVLLLAVSGVMVFVERKR
jgi:multicomponent Na+:H+ antiporter subunit B